MSTILKILEELKPEFDFREGDDFIEEGMLDSFDIIALVSTFDETYGISIDGTDIVPEHFASLEALQALLAKYGVTP